MATEYSETKERRLSKIVMMTGAFMLMAAVTACSSGSANWQHPTKPKDQWSADIAACKTQANTLLARHMDIESDASFRERDDLQQQFAAYDARKKRYSYFTNCLAGKGFRQTTE